LIERLSDVPTLGYYLEEKRKKLVGFMVMVLLKENQIIS
jgi:hypothetical protein